MAICRFHKNVTYGRKNPPTRQAVKETPVKNTKKHPVLIFNKIECFAQKLLIQSHLYSWKGLKAALNGLRLL